jgi:TnpA family transposase
MLEDKKKELVNQYNDVGISGTNFVELLKLYRFSLSPRFKNTCTHKIKCVNNSTVYLNVNSKQIAPTTKIKIIKTMDELNKKIKGS